MLRKDIINSKLYIYGINSFINKLENSEGIQIFDLSVLKNEFDIDFKYNDSEKQIEETELPAFTQLTYNQRIKGIDAFDESFNKPPIGPLEKFTYCIHCNQIACDYEDKKVNICNCCNYHTNDCPYPEKRSLYLTIYGFYIYIIQSFNEFDEFNDIKKKWLNKTLSQDDLNKILFIPNSINLENIYNLNIEDTYKNEFTNVLYTDVIKTRGPKKLEYTTATQKFNNTIMISYDYYNNEDIRKKTSIRIYENGLINLINIPYNLKAKNDLYDSIKEKLNVEGFNLENFNTLLKLNSSNEVSKFTIIDKFSYVHSINAQFTLWDEKEKYSINFENLDNLISKYNTSGELISIDPIIEIKELKTSFKQKKIVLSNPLNPKEFINIINWEFITGRETKLQTKSRDQIKCVILFDDGIKIVLQIHIHGTFQMSMSFCNIRDFEKYNCIKSNSKLNDSYLKIVQKIFTELFKYDKYDLFTLNLEYLPDNIKEARNTVSGKAPPKKLGTTTEVCRNKDSRANFNRKLRPVPYSFNGQCSEATQYIHPVGILGNDNLYYPCCATKTQKADDEYKNFLKNGFPANKAESIKYGIINGIDTKSGIIIPGSDTIGAITKAFINDDWVSVKIIEVNKKLNKLKVLNLNNNKEEYISRTDLIRDSRFFIGLNYLSREQLLKCIFSKFSKANLSEIIINLDNLTELKSKIFDIPTPNFLPILTFNDYKIFTTNIYKVSYIPQNTEFYFLYIDKNNSYFINLTGNKINKDLDLTKQLNEIIIFAGFLDINTNIYYISDLLYYIKKFDNTYTLTSKIIIINQLITTYFILDENIKILNYYNNIIEDSKKILEEYNDINLIFVPETDSLHNFKIWIDYDIIKNKINTDELILQVIKKNRTNYYVLGFDNKIISNFNLPINFNDIQIPNKFFIDNNIQINDYILFKIDYNKDTKQLAQKPLIPQTKINKPLISYEHFINLLFIIFKPIEKSFFIENSSEWIIPNTDDILTFINKESPLKIN